MINPFEKHKVEYLSPSSINKFRKNPAKWLVNIAGYRDSLYAPAMTFGNVIETGITHACMKPHTHIDESVSMAIEKLNIIHKEVHEAKAEYDFDKCKFYESLIAPALYKTIPIYKSFGPVKQPQAKVEYQFDSLPIPVIGYVDMLYEDKVRDIKATMRQPVLRSDYLRQTSFYALCTGCEPYLDYVVANKSKQELITYHVEDAQSHVKDMERIANKMMKLLSFSSDIHEVCQMSCLEPDISNEDFMNQWGPKEIEGAKKLFEV